MKILMISNPDNEEYVDDTFLADMFIQDGHTVRIVRKDYPEELEDEFDIILKRNSYDSNESNFKIGVDAYPFLSRVQAKNLPRINCDAQFDGKGKYYLVDLFQKGYAVIPTVNHINDLPKLPNAQTYLLKPHNGFAGFGIQALSKDEIPFHFTEDYVIQPKLTFQSEVQFYFVGNTFEYALEYCPSKIPDWPDPHEYNFTDQEMALAQRFADLSPNYNGVQRIDFIKLQDGQLLLLEIEDSSPNLSLYLLDSERKMKFAADYKAMVYNYYNHFKGSKN